MADEQQLGIQVIADVESAIESLKNLLDSITNIPNDKTSVIDVETENTEEVTELKEDIDSVDGKNVDIDANVEGDAESSINSLKSDTDELDNTNIDLNVDGSGIESADEDVKGLTDDLKGAGDAADDLTDDLNNTGDAAGNASSGIDDTADSTNDVGVAAGLAGLGIGAMVSNAVNGAGNVQDSWLRMGAVMGESSSQVQDDWDDAIGQMTSVTGQGAGAAREYITQMGNAGITNKDILTQGFEDVSGAAFLTGNSIQGVSMAYQRVVMTGNLGSRQLMQLGIDSQDVYKATGMSVEELSQKMKGMTQDQRAQMLNNIMNAKDGTAANEAYKQSWQHVTDMLSRSYEYLLRMFGSLILPIVIPALTLLTGVLNNTANWINNLNGPLGGAIKLFLGLATGAAAVIGVALALAAAYNVLKIPQAIVSLQTAYQTVVMGAQKAAMIASALATDGLSGAMAVLRGATTLQIAEAAAFTGQTELATAAQNESKAAMIAAKIETIASTVYTGALTAATALYDAATSGSILSTTGAAASRGVMAVASGVAAAASGVLTAAQWALNLALDANPIGLVVIAIAAFVAALLWAYNNIKPVHDAINGLWIFLDAFWKAITGFDGSKLWEWLWSGLTQAGQYIYNFFNSLASFLMNLPTNMRKWGHDIILGLISGIINAIPGLRDALSAIGLNFPQSPPKEGPLSLVTEEGAESWTSNIAGAMGRGLSNFSVADSIGNLPSFSAIPNASSISNPNTANTNLHLTVAEGAVVIKGNADKDVIANAGKTFGENASPSILQGLRNNGGNASSLMRQ